MTRVRQHTTATVAQVHQLRDAGCTPRQIEAILARRGTPVTYWTIRRWTEPKLAERTRVRTRENERRRQQRLRAGGLPLTYPEGVFPL